VINSQAEEEARLSGKVEKSKLQQGELRSTSGGFIPV
jgi:hypothetical protein